MRSRSEHAAEYRELEDGVSPPTFETRDRICKTLGRTQTFAAHG
jgi:hypothetical protein